MKKKMLAVMLSAVMSLAMASVSFASAGWIKAADGRWWYSLNDAGSSWYHGSSNKALWQLINGKWYAFDDAGWMYAGTTVDGYTLGSDGAWVPGGTQGSGAASIVSKNYTRELSDSNGKGKVTADYPVVSGCAGANAINTYFKDYIDKTYKNSTDLETDSRYGSEYTFSYTVKANTARYIGMTTEDYGYTGGAHGYGGESGLVFDSATGAKLNLSDIAADETSLQDFAKAWIINNIQTTDKINDVFSDASFGDTYDQSVNKADLNNGWYADANGLTFIFNQYEIGPYSSGIFEFTIPWSEAGAYLNAYGTGLFIG